LVNARKKAGLSQQELASRLKTSQTVIARIESGERRVDVVELGEFATLYAKSVTRFLR